MEKKYVLKSVVLVVLIGLGVVFVSVFYNSPRDPNDLTRVYSAKDFPNADLDNERTFEQFEELNNVITRLRTDPDHTLTYDRWIHVANLKLAFNDYHGSEAAYLKAIEVDDKKPLAYLNLGSLYKLHLRDYPLAEKYYQQALQRITVPYYSDFESIAELYVVFWPEMQFDVEGFMLEGAAQFADISKIPFYHYLFNYFDLQKDQQKTKEYRDLIFAINPAYDLNESVIPYAQAS